MVRRGTASLCQSPLRRSGCCRSLPWVLLRRNMVACAVQSGRAQGAFPPRREQPLEMRDPARSITPGRVDFRG